MGSHDKDDSSHFVPLIALETYSEMLICVAKSEIWIQIAEARV